MKQQQLYSAALAALIVIGLITLGAMMRANVPEDPSPVSASAKQSPAVAQATSEINVIVSRQSSEGITQDQMSQAFLANLEAYTVERVKERIREHYAALGQATPPINVRSESNFVEVQGKKLAIVRLIEPGVSNSVTIVGINGHELIRVLCATKSPFQIEITIGVCAAKLSEMFGVRIGG